MVNSTSPQRTAPIVIITTNWAVIAGIFWPAVGSRRGMRPGGSPRMTCGVWVNTIPTRNPAITTKPNHVSPATKKGSAQMAHSVISVARVRRIAGRSSSSLARSMFMTILPQMSKGKLEDIAHRVEEDVGGGAAGHIHLELDLPAAIEAHRHPIGERLPGGKVDAAGRGQRRTGEESQIATRGGADHRHIAHHTHRASRDTDAIHHDARHLQGVG